MEVIQGKWTDEQWSAITIHDRDILVAAAAGSGKTAVLVERIIHRISKTDQPIDIDQMLVVTFTNAAAAEMRHRISERLERELCEFPQSEHLQRQLTLLNHASISTLHSFCLDVVRKFYYLIEIDPDFRIGDTNEILLLKEEILEGVLEKAFEERIGGAFYAMVDAYSNDRDDKELQMMILRLYDFAMSHPEPDVWLQGVVDSYSVEGMTSIDELPWAKDFIADIQLQLSGIGEVLESALMMAQSPGGPEPYIETLTADMQVLEQMLTASRHSWDQLYEEFQTSVFGRLKSCKKDSCDPAIQLQVKELRDQVKNAVKKLKECIFSRNSQEYLRDIIYMAPIVGELVSVVREFAKEFHLAKTGKRIVDFTDLEHYCLQILRGSEPGILSEASQYYRRKFKEVLIDEYQDTNLVQESILQFITAPGNTVFMVGDVQPSTSRFRLAEPELFLSKYKRYLAGDFPEQMAIDLSKNFRSAKGIIDGTNYIFSQIMDETVGEIAYDEKASLVYGADSETSEEAAVSLVLLDKTDQPVNQDADGNETDTGCLDGVEDVADTGDTEDADSMDESIEDLQTVQLEARVMANKIREIVAASHGTIRYRDMVILLRATSSWAQPIIDELKQAGIPAHAELAAGYFTAVEITVMMSLLQVIDNPYQDIPLTAVLRSPIVGLNGEQLSQIRLCDKGDSYYEALKTFVQSGLPPDVVEQMPCAFALPVQDFFRQLQTWRSMARQGALSDLIWQIYQDTGYYDYVGGMEAGKQRQANLQALYDRAVAYEKSSFRGLFRFLKFMERMRERGGDLGAARALGEQEDVVRVMTIHKSKGLEFPVVFVAGLGRQFNLQDVRGKYLIHKKLGFGTALIDTKRRQTYPLLSQLAIRQRIKMEQLAEEMRVLYVALTRAKGKLFLVGTSKNLRNSLNGWQRCISATNGVLPDYTRANARCYLDWLMPALLRHRDAAPLYDVLDGIALDGASGETSSRHAISRGEFGVFQEHPSRWDIQVWQGKNLLQNGETVERQNQQIEDLIRERRMVGSGSEYRDQVCRRLEWVYPHKRASELLAKQSVSDLKRHRQSAEDFAKPLIQRPMFMQQERLTAAERGTVMHTLMQHINLQTEITLEGVQALVRTLIDRQFITEDQAQTVSLADITSFFTTDIGKRLLRADNVQREISFSLAIPASSVYDDWHDGDEPLLVQGIVDCVFEDVGGLVLLDYKSDRIKGITEEQLMERYRVQMDLYSRAIETIWNKKVSERYLYFFDNCKFLHI